MQVGFVRELAVPAENAKGTLAQIIRDKKLAGRLIGVPQIVALQPARGEVQYACALTYRAERGGRGAAVSAALFPADAKGEITNKTPIIDATSHSLALPAHPSAVKSFSQNVIQRLAHDLQRG